ncbi:DEAD/DEAH box helicase family protein [Rummeliibacillus sp. TYF005]|uniref:DEAD/DEAH box helicase family protein n=1 Tax=Rummeliibacillus sp. TYF005 TaxID=2058214 RepID=UPI0013DE26AD|nr:DEAD/DEAH box helicase family protein [Rummeliibacillus sp. TYF005]
MKYLSDYIKENDFKKWIESNEDILLIANAGAGKTYLLLEQFVSYAKEKGLKVLYCYNRNSMRTQFAAAYENKYDNLTITIYQSLEKKCLFSKNDQYLTEYDVILCDECHYFVSDSWNKNTYISFEKIQRNNAKKIYFTASPEPFFAIHSLIKNSFNVIDMRSLTQQNVDTIYITSGQTLFYEAEEYFLKQNKVIHFENNKENNMKLALKYASKGYKTVTLDADSNNEITKLIDSTSNEQNIFVDFLATTSTNENGVNFNIENNVMITLAKNFDFTSIVQSSARLRKFNDNHISMLINTPHKTLLQTCFKSNEKKLKELCKKKNDLMKASSLVVSILKYDFYIARLDLENKTIDEMLKTKDLALFYETKLKELFSNASVKVIDKYDLIPIEEVLNDLLANDDQIILEKDMQQLVKDTLCIGISKIKEKMIEKFEVTTDRKTNEGHKETIWIIKRIAKN